MRRRLLTAVMGLIALCALIALPWAGWAEAERQAYDGAAEVATGYARDILYRTDKTTAQSRDALTRLRDAALAPCSPAEMRLMGEIDLSSSYIQAVGRVAGGAVQCSSINGAEIDLGKDVYLTPRGVKLFLDVSIRGQDASSILALQQDDFFAIVHRQLPLDTWTASRDVALGVFQIDRPLTHGPEIARGKVSRTWLNHLGKRSETTFIEGDHLIAVVRSAQFRIAAVASMPLTDLVARRDAIAVRLVPAGIVLGVLAALAILSFGRRQASLATALRGALRNRELFVDYQPIVALASGRCIGVEALLRWRRPTGELIAPDLFIPAAEQAGLITSITERMLQLVQHDTGAWLAAHPDFHVAVNLSPADIESPTLVAWLDRFMRETGARPASLTLEITERGLVDIAAARDVMRQLHARGYEIAIDDFGTGYSSLSYLESLELDILKIDRAFVEAIGTRAPTSQVVNHIIAMARAMGMRMVAEGVERQSQADYLQAHQVQYAQGWLFGRPGSFDAIVARMDSEAKADDRAALLAIGGR